MTHSEEKNNKKRNKFLLGAGLVFALAGGGAFAYNYFIGEYHETTDNAYTQGEVFMITPQTTGVVQEVFVQETQSVKKADPLVVLDDRDAKIALEKAKETLALNVREVVGIHKRVEESKAMLKIAQKELDEAEQDLHRRASLIQSGAISKEEYAHVVQRVEKAKDSLLGQEKHKASLESSIQGLSIEENPTVKLAAVNVEEALLAYKRCRILAPSDGIVAKKSVQPGQKIASGQSIMAVVAHTQMWVDANFKETQLTNLRIGQPVTLHSDIYGKGITFHGTIEGMSPGTGASFSLLPAQNASGNWIKIVQRVPVRIRLDAQEIKNHPLRVGLSMVIDVDTHDRSGSVLLSPEQGERSIESSMYEDVHEEAQQLIQRIIATNQ